MTEEELEATRAQARREMEVVDDLHKRLAKEIEVLFGNSFTLQRNFAIARDAWEWTVWSKYLGRRCRFGMEIPAEQTENKFALEYLLSQLPYQMQDQAEEYSNAIDGYFAVARNDDTGVVNPGIHIYPPIGEE